MDISSGIEKYSHLQYGTPFKKVAVNEDRIF